MFDWPVDWEAAAVHSIIREDLPIEPLWWLKSCDATAYHHSRHWLTLRQRYLDEHEHVCFLCGIRSIGEIQRVERVGEYVDKNHDFRYCAPGSTKAAEIHERDLEPAPREPVFVVHHVTYDRIGRERDEDFRLVCSPCHQLIHKPECAPARYWAEHNADQPDLTGRAAALRPGWYPWASDRD